MILPPARDRQKRKIERSASAALEVEVDGNATIPLCAAFVVVIEYFIEFFRFSLNPSQFGIIRVILYLGGIF